MALDAYAWIPTIQPVKEFLELESDRDVPILERITNAATSAMERTLGRKIIEREHTAIFDGNGRTQMLLPHYPIVEIDSLYLARSVLGDGIAQDPAYYEWNENDPEEGILYLIGGGTFPKGKRNVKIVWTAGYVAKATEGHYLIPPDLVDLLLQWVKYLWKKRDAIGEERLSESVQGATITFATSFWTAERKSILAKYRVYG